MQTLRFICVQICFVLICFNTFVEVGVFIGSYCSGGEDTYTHIRVPHMSEKWKYNC